MDKLKELDTEMDNLLPIDMNKAIVMAGKYIGALRKIVEEQNLQIEKLQKDLIHLEDRTHNIENYKGFCIGNGIWPVDSDSKMKEI